MSARVSSGRESKQDYETPWPFIHAVEVRFGKLAWDLAATKENTKAPLCIEPWSDSLSETCRWPFHAHCWLNPPFQKITPWAAKCASSGFGWPNLGRLFFLVPASIGSNWFARHVHGKALVLGLNGPRLSFDGVAPFPKDLMLCIYGERPGFDVWRWK